MDKNQKKKIMPTVFAVATIIVSLLYIGLFIILALTESIMWIFSGIAIVLYSAVCIGIIVALRERIKEIDGGEEDEALKY